MRGFSGHFPPSQLLYLWDLVLAYDSMEVFPLLAASILSFRNVIFSDIVTFAFSPLFPALLRLKVTCLISDKMVFCEPPPS